MFRKIYDISPTISTRLAIFPGDTPYSSSSTSSADSLISDIRTNLHIGAHLDAPLHTLPGSKAIDQLDLSNFIGMCQVVALSVSKNQAITPDLFSKIELTEQRILIATNTYNPLRWSPDYAAFHPETVDFFHSKKVRLIGIDTPSVDLYTASHLPAHKRMAELEIIGLENICLNNIKQGRYQLVALPLKLEGLEASPVRAVLIEL